MWPNIPPIPPLILHVPIAPLVALSPNAPVLATGAPDTNADEKLLTENDILRAEIQRLQTLQAESINNHLSLEKELAKLSQGQTVITDAVEGKGLTFKDILSGIAAGSWAVLLAIGVVFWWGRSFIAKILETAMKPHVPELELLQADIASIKALLNERLRSPDSDRPVVYQPAYQPTYPPYPPSDDRDHYARSYEHPYDPHGHSNIRSEATSQVKDIDPYSSDTIQSETAEVVSSEGTREATEIHSETTWSDDSDQMP